MSKALPEIPVSVKGGTEQVAVIEQWPKAFGAPGIAPRWTHSAKDVVGTAYSTASTIWFTISDGVISEVYYPTIDQPQIRDLQFVMTDGESFFHDTHRNLHSEASYLDPCGLATRIVNTDPQGRYQVVMRVLSDPYQPCLLIDTQLEGDPELISRLHMYALLAPHLEVGGWNNSGNSARIVGREFLIAHKGVTWLAMAASTPFLRRSCGYVGTTDGWTDLATNYKMDYEFATAENGNIALIGEIDLHSSRHFTLGLAFGHSLHRAISNLSNSLSTPFETHRAQFQSQWQQGCSHFLPLERWSLDGGSLYQKSCQLLLAHEDKNYAGALIASMTIPWGETRGDEDLGGYHLVWTRDLVNSVTGLFAAGDTATPERALIYLACSQQPDGGFPQNFWIDGNAYWGGIQLDEVAFPIILAWRLAKSGALTNFDCYPMVRAAARYLVTHGPCTPQERWEEASGFSPSTLASNIAALICAACFARRHGDEASATLLEDYADFLESHIEKWTVTNRGSLIAGITRHYVRIAAANPYDPWPNEDPDRTMVPIKNRAPEVPAQFHASEIVDAGFLELVRYGIRKPEDRLIVDSLRVVDASLKTDFPAGPCWRRYNHDGYGQRDDGSPYTGWGRGRPWPLLTGERGHYELAAGRDATPYLRAMEGFATATRLLPEQLWDEADIPAALMRYAGPTGAAMPLMWAHAEYIKLLRSTADGQVFDLIEEVADRYLHSRPAKHLEVWKFNRQINAVAPGTTLRIQVNAPFNLHWTNNDWADAVDTRSTVTGLEVDYADIEIEPGQRAPIRFTFFWTRAGRWENRDFVVEIRGD